MSIDQRREHASDEAWFARHYNGLPAPEPGAELDARIQAAARTAVKGGHTSPTGDPAPPHRRSWRLAVPLAAAATLLVVVSLWMPATPDAPVLTRSDTDAAPVTPTPTPYPGLEVMPAYAQDEMYVPCQRVRGAYLVPQRRDALVACPREDHWHVTLRVADNACRESEIPVRGEPQFDAETADDNIDVVVLRDAAGVRRLRCTERGWQQWHTS